MDNRENNVMKDLAIVALSVVVAVILVQTGVLKNVLTSTREMRFLGSFLAGVFFVSIFTAAPATVALGEIAKSHSIFATAAIGGFGALLGDWLIFRFVKDRLSEKFLRLVRTAKSERLASVFRLKLFHWLIPLLGALVVASPLPDELGLLMMGLSKMKTPLFLSLSFLLNAFGILIIGYIAKAI